MNKRDATEAPSETVTPALKSADKTNPAAESFLLLTDPRCEGVVGGDVDDHIAIAELAKKWGKKLTIVICDDTLEADRFEIFKKDYGDDFIRFYGCKIIKERDLWHEHVPHNTCVIHHSPVSPGTVAMLQTIAGNISHLYTQGSLPTDVNFKKGDMYSLLTRLRKTKGVYVFSATSANTRVQCSVNKELLAGLPTTTKRLYTALEFTQTLQALGFALGDFAWLANRLYSNTGFNGALGTKWAQFADVVETLQKTPKKGGEGFVMPSDDELKDETYKQIEDLYDKKLGQEPGVVKDESVVKNIRAIIWCLNEAFNYDEVRGVEIPTMTTLKSNSLVMKSNCRQEIIDALFGKTVMLYDLISAAGVTGTITTEEKLTPKELQIIVESIINDMAAVERKSSAPSSFAGSDGTRGITGVKRDGGKRFTRKLKPMNRKRTNKKRNRTNKKRNTNKRINRRKTLR